MGSTGRTHGERTVTKPDKSENRIKISMKNLLVVFLIKYRAKEEDILLAMY
jgi:hypothetical protein